MTNDDAVRIALEHAALVVAARRYVREHGHEQGGCRLDPCLLCEALAVIDRPQPRPTNPTPRSFCDHTWALADYGGQYCSKCHSVRPTAAWPIPGEDD